MSDDMEKREIYNVFFTGQFVWRVEFNEPVTADEAEAMFLNGDFYDVLDEEEIEILEVDAVQQTRD